MLNGIKHLIENLSLFVALNPF